MFHAATPARDRTATGGMVWPFGVTAGLCRACAVPVALLPLALVRHGLGLDGRATLAHPRPRSSDVYQHPAAR